MLFASTKSAGVLPGSPISFVGRREGEKLCFFKLMTRPKQRPVENAMKRRTAFKDKRNELNYGNYGRCEKI